MVVVHTPPPPSPSPYHVNKPPKCTNPTYLLSTPSQELRCIWSVGKKWDPYMPTRTREALIHGWHKAVERSLGWVNKEEGTEEGGAGTHEGGEEFEGSRSGGAGGGGEGAPGGEKGEGGGAGGLGPGNRPRLKRFATMRMKRMDSDARKKTLAKEIRKQLRAVDWGVVGGAALFVLGGLGVGFMLGNRYKLTRA